MVDASLHPIVIGAILAGQFECLGDGLLHDGVEREQPNTLKDLLVPTKTSKRTPIEDRERPKKWWRAQCIHYALPAPASAPISTYRVHLENAIRQRGGLKRPQDLADLEFEQNTKFRRLNAEVRSATQGSDQAKAPKKSKAVKPAPAPAPVAEPVSAKVKAKVEPKARAEPKAKAESKLKAEPKPKAEPKAKAKTESKVKEIPVEPAAKATSKKRKADTIVHVYHYDGERAQAGPKAPAAKQEQVKPPPAKKARTKAPAVASAPTRALETMSDSPPSYSEIEDRPEPSSSQTARKGIPGMYSGTYELDCTSEEEWPGYDKPTLEVFMSKSGQPLFKGLLLLPGLLTCLLRLKPRASAPEDGYVRFEWCGREEGEGQVQTPSANNIGWMKIHKAEGRVKGMIQTTYGNFSFHGPRIDSRAPEIQYEWEEFNEEAYEYANRARWGGSSW